MQTLRASTPGEGKLKFGQKTQTNFDATCPLIFQNIRKAQKPMPPVGPEGQM
jgi:hypothetical protein